MKLNRLFEAKYGKNINITSKRLTLLPSDLPDEVVGNFFCSDNRLTSLEHCPTKVGGSFYCQFNNLTSLEHCPSDVGGDFYCCHNKLTSLEFCPSHIGGNFLCNDNELTSLEHCPSQIGGDFHCSHNELTSLKFCPSQIGGYFACSHNELTSLKFCPSQIGGNFSCSHNELTSLKDIHTHIRKVDGGFRCYSNHIESHILGLMLIEIGREIITRLGNGSDVDEILNKWKNQGRKGVLGAQRELFDLGYDQLAQL